MYFFILESIQECCTNTTITNSEFEKVVSEWLRHANTRYSRQKNNNEIDSFSVEDKIANFTIPEELTQLPKFLYAFHAALRVLQIEGIKPLEGYKVLREYSIEQDRLDNQKLWSDTSKELTASLLKIRGNTDDIRLEPPFILALKALLSVLGKRWAEKWKNRV